MIVSGLVRGARGVKLTSHADVIGVILCLDVAIIAAPDELKGLILRSRAPDDIIVQHLFLLLAGIVLWMLVLIGLEPIVLGERNPWRTSSGVVFAGRSPRAEKRLPSLYLHWTAFRRIFFTLPRRVDMDLLATAASLVALVCGIITIGLWAARRGQFSSPETHLQHMEYAWEMSRNSYHVRSTSLHTESTTDVDHHGMVARG